jgi:hypothetical protein
MINNEYYPDEKQHLVLQKFKRLRAVFGTPHPYTYIRVLAQTRKFTRTVYPPGWRYM